VLLAQFVCVCVRQTALQSIHACAERRDGARATAFLIQRLQPAKDINSQYIKKTAEPNQDQSRFKPGNKQNSGVGAAAISRMKYTVVSDRAIETTTFAYSSPAQIPLSGDVSDLMRQLQSVMVLPPSVRQSLEMPAVVVHRSRCSYPDMAQGIWGLTYGPQIDKSPEFGD